MNSKIMGVMGLMGLVLCGCGPREQARPARWEYKVMEVGNSNDNDSGPALSAWAAATPGTEKAREAKTRLDYAKESMGQILLSETELDQLGSDGWELAGSFAQTETIATEGHGVNIRTGKAVLIFKRQRPGL